MANYKPEVLVGGVWLESTRVFHTEAEALEAAFKLLENWPEATDYRASATYLPVNSLNDQEYVWINPVEK